MYECILAYSTFCTWTCSYYKYLQTSNSHSIAWVFFIFVSNFLEQKRNQSDFTCSQSVCSWLFHFPFRESIFYARRLFPFPFIFGSRNDYVDRKYSSIQDTFRWTTMHTKRSKSHFICICALKIRIKVNEASSSIYIIYLYNGFYIVK